MSRKFVDAIWIRQRMQDKDDRCARALRHRLPKFLQPETPGFVEVTIVRAPDATGPVVDVGLEPAPTMAADCDTCLRHTGEIVELIAGVCPVCRRGAA
jgi:hypothetical protein